MFSRISEPSTVLHPLSVVLNITKTGRYRWRSTHLLFGGCLRGTSIATPLVFWKRTVKNYLFVVFTNQKKHEMWGWSNTPNWCGLAEEKAAQERWEEKFSLMLFGWDIDSFLPCSVSLLFHISLPHLCGKGLAEPLFNECVKPLGERFMFNDCDHT